MTSLPVLDPGFHTPSTGEQATDAQKAERAELAEKADLVGRCEAVKPDLGSEADLSDLAAEIERNGIDSIKLSILAELVHQGLMCGLQQEVADVISDGSAPAVARERAFGLLHRRLAGHESAGPR